MHRELLRPGVLRADSAMSWCALVVVLIALLWRGSEAGDE